MEKNWREERRAQCIHTVKHCARSKQEPWTCVRVSGFEAGLAVFKCTHHVVVVSFVFLLCLFFALVRTARCLSLSPSFVLAEALHVGLLLFFFFFFFFFFSSLVIHVLLLLSSCLSCWKDCACRGKLSSSDTWHCLSVLTNLVGPPLAGVTLVLRKLVWILCVYPLPPLPFPSHTRTRSHTNMRTYT